MCSASLGFCCHYIVVYVNAVVQQLGNVGIPAFFNISVPVSRSSLWSYLAESELCGA